MSRRRTTTLLAAALVCLPLAGCGGSTPDDSPTAESTTGSSVSESSAEPVDLVVAAPTNARCMAPSAEALATQDTAFEGTVTALSDGTATLAVEQWFEGDAGADEVTVSTPSQELQDLLVAVEFQEDRTYLVSALKGRVSLCGFTAESTPELEALYEEAFAG